KRLRFFDTYSQRIVHIQKQPMQLAVNPSMGARARHPRRTRLHQLLLNSTLANKISKKIDELQPLSLWCSGVCSTDRMPYAAGMRHSSLQGCIYGESV